MVMQDQFIEVLKEALEAEDKEIKMQDEFREYEEWDSLAQLSLIAALDETFGVEIEDDDFQKLNTVADLFKAVQERSS